MESYITLCTGSSKNRTTCYAINDLLSLTIKIFSSNPTTAIRDKCELSLFHEFDLERINLIENNDEKNLPFSISMIYDSKKYYLCFSDSSTMVLWKSALKIPFKDHKSVNDFEDIFESIITVPFPPEPMPLQQENENVTEIRNRMYTKLKEIEDLQDEVKVDEVELPINPQMKISESQAEIKNMHEENLKYKEAKSFPSTNDVGLYVGKLFSRNVQICLKPFDRAIYLYSDDEKKERIAKIDCRLYQGTVEMYVIITMIWIYIIIGVFFYIVSRGVLVVW